MSLANIPYLDAVTEFHALDTSRADLGAPGIPGALRFHNHPTYGLQIYRLTLNEYATPLVVGKHYLLSAPGAGLERAGPTISSVGVAATQPNQSAGVAVVAATEDTWTWMLVDGLGLILAGAEITVNDGLEFGAAGVFEDVTTGGAGTVVVGIALATIATGVTGVARIRLL